MHCGSVPSVAMCCAAERDGVRKLLRQSQVVLGRASNCQRLHCCLQARGKEPDARERARRGQGGHRCRVRRARQHATRSNCCRGVRHRWCAPASRSSPARTRSACAAAAGRAGRAGCTHFEGGRRRGRRRARRFRRGAPASTPEAPACSSSQQRVSACRNVISACSRSQASGAGAGGRRSAVPRHARGSSAAAQPHGLLLLGRACRCVQEQERACAHLGRAGTSAERRGAGKGDDDCSWPTQHELARTP